MDKRVVILGAGPAGLTAALELSRHNVPAEVIEQDSLVGGLARTVCYQGYYFDIGGHRFFTKVEEVKRIWHDVLGEDLLERGRLSRIYYRGKFFQYPLKPLNALAGLGPVEAVRIFFSYLYAQLRPQLPEETFEQWVSNRFGRRLARFDNLQVVGRNGMHRYNNQDHSMLTALLAARNILGAHYDLWSVNTETEYLEEVKT